MNHKTLNRSNWTFVAGLVCGTAVGATFGLLLAPRRGSELRQQISESVEQATRRAASSYDQASAAVHDAIAAGREAVKQSRDLVVPKKHTPGNGGLGVASPTGRV